MSGHSKWSTIKRKKGAADAKRSKIFSKVNKEITIAVKASGIDPDSNPQLRLAIANAKGCNMPKDNITRAINKAADKDTSNFTEVTYEGYAPNGVGVFVECLTDNLQRTISSVRSYFNKFNGSLGKNGCLSFVFDRKGIFSIPVGELDQDEFEMEVIDGGAEDIVLEDGFFTITTAMEDFGSMQKKLEEIGVEAESAKLERIPVNTEKLTVDQARTIMKLVDLIEEDDDVQDVYHNLELTDEIIAELESE